MDALCDLAAYSGRRSDGEGLHLTAKGFWARNEGKSPQVGLASRAR